MSMMVAGVITASGAHYLQELEADLCAADGYVADANERFREYERILPGSVEYLHCPILNKLRPFARKPFCSHTG